MRNCRDWLGCGAKRLDAQGKTRQKKSANSCERVEQAGAVTMSRVELLNGTGTEGAGICDTITTDIKLCSKKSRRANLSASGLMLQETNDRNKQNCPGKHRIGSLSMTRDR